MTVVHQAPLSMGFSRQEYLSGLTFTSSGDLPNPGMETGSPALQADTLSSEPSNYGAFWLILKSHPHHVDLNVSIGLSQLKLI